MFTSVENKMEHKKVQRNCWVDPKVDALIKQQAKIEGRRPGNLGGLLLEWAVDQLQRAGNSIVLKNWVATAPSTEVPPKLDLAVHSQESNAPVNMDARVGALLNELGKHRGRPGAKKRKSGSHRA
jgi:hypothetical protein